MKHTIKKDKTKNIVNILRYFWVVMLVCAFTLWISLCMLVDRHQPENIAVIHSEVQSVEYDEEDDRYE